MQEFKVKVNLDGLQALRDVTIDGDVSFSIEGGQPNVGLKVLTIIQARAEISDATELRGLHTLKFQMTMPNQEYDIKKLCT